jgi:hypothetical protein
MNLTLFDELIVEDDWLANVDIIQIGEKMKQLCTF